MSPNPPHSYHIFLFPFKWNHLTSTDKQMMEIDIDERLDVKQFEKQLLASHQWKEVKFSIENGQDYNEWSYFFDFSRSILFPDGTDKINKRYRYIEGDLEYVIKLYNRQKKIYTLSVDSIQLDCYNTGIAIMAFYLANHDTTTTRQDILNINDFGRRIYPQFLSLSDKNDLKADEKITSLTKQTFLADEIIIQSQKVGNTNTSQFSDEVIVYADDDINENTSSKRVITKENFSRYETLSNLKDIPLEIASIIRDLLGENFTQSRNRTSLEKIFIEPVIDDRMFVLCWFGNNALIRQLRKYNSNDKSYNYETGDFWHKFIFIDNANPSCSNLDFKREQIRKSTNTRWVEGKDNLPKGNTIYGITRYSFMVISDQSDLSKKVILSHLKTVYAKLAILCLAQRASILQFSKEATILAELANKKDINTRTNISKLYLKYLLFINKIHFREVTAQEQGIEMYEKLHELMKIEQNVKDLEGEIKGLLNYVELEENKKRTEIEEERKNEEEGRKEAEELKAKRFNDITVGLASISIPSLIVGYYGMNTFNPKLIEFEGISHWFFVGFLIISPILLFLIFTDRNPKWKDFVKANSYKVVCSVFMIVFVGIALSYPIWKAETKDKRPTRDDTIKVYSPQTDILKSEVSTIREEIKLLKDSLLKQQNEHRKLLKQIKDKLK